MTRCSELAGIDGSNPLGFLAALGTLVSLAEAGIGDPKLGWKRAHRWVPVLEGIDADDDEEFAELVAECLSGSMVSSDAEARRDAAEREMEAAKKAKKDKQAEIKGRGLRGAERTEALATELQPLEVELENKRRVWLEALREAVPRPELALGKRIDCTPEEYREHAAAMSASAGESNRGPIDLLASFGTDACRTTRDGGEVIEATPFCFISGGGRQYFLETARKLLDKVSSENVHRVLFERWDYADEGLSMRWDPIEDRRYALMDRDPTASDNKVTTMWMANLLAYRSLALFPAAPDGKRLKAAGWDLEQSAFTWPLWESPVGADVVRSLVQLPELVTDSPDAPILRARGIVAVYRGNRIKVGTGANRKLNFSLARRVM